MEERNEILNKFHPTNSSEKPLKLEYLRELIMRAIKKLIRAILKNPDSVLGGTWSNKKTNKFNSMDILRILVDLVIWDSELWVSIVDRGKDPNVDNRELIRRGEMPPGEFPSYNSAYVHRFYSNDLVRRFHYYYTKLFFGPDTIDVDDVASKLKVTCCDGNHTDQCEVNFKQLREYVMFGMLEEVGVVPYREIQETKICEGGYFDPTDCYDLDYSFVT